LNRQLQLKWIDEQAGLCCGSGRSAFQFFLNQGFVYRRSGGVASPGREEMSEHSHLRVLT